VIGVVPGIVGCVEAAEAIKILAGFGEVLENRLFTIDVKNMVTAVIDY
jgi:adenylyltransferase/sulfurtransferase